MISEDMKIRQLQSSDSSVSERIPRGREALRFAAANIWKPRRGSQSRRTAYLLCPSFAHRDQTFFLLASQLAEDIVSISVLAHRYPSVSH